MKKIPLLAFAFISILNLAALPSLKADEVKFPEKSDPSFTFTTPAGWKTKLMDLGNPHAFALNVETGGPNGLSLTMIELPADAIAEIKTTKDPMSIVATSAFQTAQFKKTDKVGQDEIGGIKGPTYYGTRDSGTGTTITFKLTLLMVDETHLASVGIIASSAITPDDQAAIDKLVASMKFNKAKPATP